jgi:orotidine-5'-phosphate decarboxylase
VVGATYPEELQIAREMAPDANFLIPGIGAQGGNLETAVQFGPDEVAGPVISASRSIIYADLSPNFAEAARAAALALRGRINAAREEKDW